MTLHLTTLIYTEKNIFTCMGVKGWLSFFHFYRLSFQCASTESVNRQLLRRLFECIFSTTFQTLSMLPALEMAFAISSDILFLITLIRELSFPQSCDNYSWVLCELQLACPDPTNKKGQVMQLGQIDAGTILMHTLLYQDITSIHTSVLTLQ